MEEYRGIPMNEEHVEALLVEMEEVGLMMSEVKDGEEIWTLTEKGESYAELLAFFLDESNAEGEE